MLKMADKKSKEFSGKVINEFTVKGDKTRTYKVGRVFETDHRNVYDMLINENKIK